MYKCIEPFTDTEGVAWLLGDKIDWVDLSYLTEAEQKNFEKIEEND